MARTKHDADTTLLCAVRFWSVAPGVSTLRAGVRTVVRRQGFSSAEIDAAERRLIAAGLYERTGKTVKLTPAAASRSCKRVSLVPWTNDGHPGARLARASRRRRR